MKQIRNRKSLFASSLPIYFKTMQKRVFNHPMLGNPRVRDSKLFQFLDVYAMSLDVEPSCYRTRAPRAADALWNDFVSISSDANETVAKSAEKQIFASVVSRTGK